MSTGRKKSRDEVDAIAQGRVWSGVDAKRLGLVDQLGSFDDAVKAAAKRAKLKDYEVDFVEPSCPGRSSWRSGAGAACEDALHARRAHEAPDARGASSSIRSQQEVERLSRLSVPNRLYAYCFCTRALSWR